MHSDETKNTRSKPAHSLALLELPAVRGVVRTLFNSKRPVLSPKVLRSSTPMSCITDMNTLAIGVPSAALRCRLPRSAPPALPARNSGQRLWLCTFELPIGEP